MNEQLDVNKVEISEKDTEETPMNLGLKEDLIQGPKPTTTNKKSSAFANFCSMVFPCIKRVDTTSRRLVYFSDQALNITNWSNKEENNKYNVVTFIPICLFNQFRQFGNFFYLLMSVSQFFPELAVGFLFTYISPLAFVVAVSMAKELYDDINRRIQDKKTNSAKITVIVPSADKSSIQLTQKDASQLQIGDIIELKKDSRVPADIIVLKTFNEAEDNQAFIRTDQLDGETDWKLRKAPGVTQAMNEIQFFTSEAFAEYEPPSKLIYNFQGVIQCKTEEGEKKEPLNLENTMWASTVVASKKVIGIVIYTGKETRAKMNSSSPKVKIGILDNEINRLNIYLFVITFIVAFIIASAKGFQNKFIFNFIKYIILFCAIIPISLRVNLDVSKTYFSVIINRDKDIPGTIARNSTIPEELGRISYVFSDKTGTLTKNEMIFKIIAMETEIFAEDKFEDLKGIVLDECKDYDAPLLDLVKSESSGSEEIESSTISISSSQSTEVKKKKRIHRHRSKLIRDTITAMCLCNNVTPVADDNDPNKMTYQASSPDEVALVKFAVTLNMRLVGRTDKEIKLTDAADNTEEFEVLANFPFSSDTKRMGIILKNKKHGHIIYYLKGAENVMMRFVKDEYVNYIAENAENLATKGLRTLVLSQKLIPQDYFDKWNKEYEEAKTSMEDRQQKIADVVSKLENNMDFLCVTGVEDLLQDDVATTIDNLRNAGMKVWMLTGDKVETATCISISAGLKAKTHKIYTIKNDEIKSEAKNEEKPPENVLLSKFEEYKRKINIDPHLFIIDGDTLDLALKNCEKDFFETAMLAPSVVCCRCSPTQKRIIVKTIKKYTDARTAAVGDGGNDVAMIQEADVGIGIVGKEGLQASLAADYSIMEFRSLNMLLLWFGRIAYKNTSMMSNFIIHRGLIIAFNQFIFSCIFYFNPVPLYSGFLSFGYSTIFTSLPCICVLLDQDVNKNNVLTFPTLYKILLKGRELNLKSFLFWLFKSIFQAFIIMFGSIILFEDTIFLKIVTVTFTALIYLEVLNVYLEINKYHWFMGISFGATLLVYLLTIGLLNNYLDIYFIFEWGTFFKIPLIAVISWAPFFIGSFIKKKFFPETIEKLNQAKSLELKSEEKKEGKKEGTPEFD
jgi:phospholipid-translocating ATPase